MSRFSNSKSDEADHGLFESSDLPIDPAFADSKGKVMKGREFLAKGRRVSIEDALDSTRFAKSYTQADGPDVSEHLAIAETALLDALSLIKEHSA